MSSTQPVGILLVAMVSATIHTVAQPFTIDWQTIDGGGGTSSGGTYELHGTAGQPDGGPTMTGGPYTLDGGFWGIVAAVQIPGAPFLTVTRAGASVVISWPAPSSGFTLEETPDIVLTNWNPVATPPVITNGENRVTVPSPVGSKYYRLFKP